jgi:hypothetical protein
MTTWMNLKWTGVRRAGNFLEQVHQQGSEVSGQSGDLCLPDSETISEAEGCVHRRTTSFRIVSENPLHEGIKQAAGLARIVLVWSPGRDKACDLYADTAIGSMKNEIW